MGEAARDPQFGVYHVITRWPNNWVVITRTAKRAIRILDTKQKAVVFAKKYALAKSKTEEITIVIHDKTGAVTDSKTFKKPTC